MNPLSALYGGLTGLRNTLYDRGIFKAHRLHDPVISVGNLSVGGSGKTPFVIMLGELLMARGFAIDILSRGYRRKSKAIMQVDPAGTAEQFGDEPLLIARKLKCPVIVGALRHHAGSWAERHLRASGGPAIHLLDDGFQHRQLAREFDIVLITPEDVGDSLLPRGRLREGFDSLARADGVVMTDEVSEEDLPIRPKHLWRVRRRLQIPEISGPVIAFAGVARPTRFFDELRRVGIEVKQEISFRDHYRYQASDIRNLLRLRERKKAFTFVTTEKDAVNLGPHLANLNPTIIPMKMEMSESEQFLDVLLEAIAQRVNCAP